MTLHDDRPIHDAAAAITDSLAALALEVADWRALEDASRELVNSVSGDDFSVVVPTQRTDELHLILTRIDERRHP